LYETTLRQSSLQIQIKILEHKTRYLARPKSGEVAGHLSRPANRAACQYHGPPSPRSSLADLLWSYLFVLYWQIFHEVRDEKEYGREGKVYPILSHPHDLRFQVSVCSQYSVFGWGEYGYLLDAWDNPTRDIAWHKSLVELLWEERWLWGNLRYCSECVKYKPESAFEEFDGQQEMMQSVSNRQEEFEFWWLGTRCKRCRAKQLFRQLGEREEVTEQRGNPWEERKSLALKKPEYNENPEELLKQNEHSWTYSRWRDECEALNSNYETWESIFSKMCI
jgi:hypothetical protein